MNRHNVAAWCAITCVVTVGLWLRWSGLSNGYTSDEVALVLPHSFWTMLTQGESAVNPPWFPALFNTLFDTHEVVLWARRWSMLMAACTLVTITFFGRAYGRGSLWAGVVAASLFAFHPWAIDHASVFRVYSTTTAVAAWHLLVVGHLLRNGASRIWQIQLITTAVLLPQLHYFWFPVLIVFGLVLLLHGKKWAWGLFASGAGMIPWLIFMARNPSHQNPSGLPGSWESIQMLATTGSHFGTYWIMPICLFGVLLYRWLNTETKLMVWGAGITLAVTAWVGQFQLVRPPISLFLLLWVCALLTGLIGSIPNPTRSRFEQPVTAITLLILILGVYRSTHALDTPAATPNNSLLIFSTSLPRHIEEYALETVVIQPDYALPVLHLYQTSRPISEAVSPCSQERHCYRHQGVRYESQIQQIDVDQQTLIFSSDWTAKPMPSHCVQLRDQTTYALWLCSKSAHEH